MSLSAMTPNKTEKSKNSSSIKNYAIVETSGSQFWLEANRYYDLDRIKGNVDEKITLDKVLLINDEKGLSVGKPYVKGARVELKIMAHKRGPKIIVYKMRPKKKTRTKNGHRQELTRVMVTSISNGAKSKKVIQDEKPIKADKTIKDTKSTKTSNPVKSTTKAKKAVNEVKKAVKEVKEAVKEVKKTQTTSSKKKDSKIQKTSD